MPTETFALGERRVHRLGFGAMRLTGPGIWGPPADPEGCVAVLRRAVELGVDLIDTADSYGPHVSEELIARALHPYPADLLIATKAGLVRTGPGGWHALGRPEYLRQECELSLRRLRLERIDLFQLHRIDPAVPSEEQFGLLGELRDEGKIAAVGLSEVSVAELETARRIVPIATVQNRYNLVDRKSDDLLEHCEREGIGFIPWFPIGSGDLAAPGGRLDAVARAIGASPAQVALAWLLARSPVMLPIPGTASVAHLEENCAAAGIGLSDEQIGELG
ncbi:MAG TPA: aldo/keto reductase [Solirubrobacteraceae bacterium]|nr:aldo/keto reductase [Solirubrobacteraceae bacterium]